MKIPMLSRLRLIPFLVCLCLGTGVFLVSPVHAKKARPAKTESSGPSYRKHVQAMAFADEFAQRHGLSRSWVRQAVGQARQNTLVQKLIAPAPTGFQKNWQVYRSRFIEPRRIQAGVAFWNQHAGLLSRAEQTWGVPATVIVGILGVETIYGRDTGGFRVIDALCTLAFDFPSSHPRAEQRQAYFRSELEQFLLMAHASDISVRDHRGSYAGAMGWPQFMPGSVSKFAVDGDGDGRIDVHNSVADIVGSVAHYMKQHGWQTGAPTHFGVALGEDLSADTMARLLAPDILPSFNIQTLLDAGLKPDVSALSYPAKLALVELKNGSDAPSHVLGTDNFYVITRYNWSAYYALAVIELGEAVARERSVQMPGLAPAAVSTVAPGAPQNALHVQ